MNRAVRVVKRRGADGSQNPQADGGGKAASREREIASTVRSWIAEREQRQRISEREHWDMLIKFAQ